MIASLLPTPPSSKRLPAKPHVAPEKVHAFVEELLAEDVHARRVLSIGNGVLGVLHAAALGVHAIGRGLAAALGLDPKHAIKQVDRLLSNRGVDVWQWFAAWAKFVVADRKEIAVALDWTHFDADKQATISLNAITSHGRATPLVWKTVDAKLLANRQGEYEREVIERLHEIVPEGVHITVIADRGFGSHALYEYLALLGWSFIIRFRQCIVVTTADGRSMPAADWVPVTGHAKMLRGVRVTGDKADVPAVVLKHQKGMKEAWCLATNRTDLGAAGVVALYGRRFTIEETFRDLKDPRFGMGLGDIRVSTPVRRDRLIFLFAMAHALLTLLGAAGEAAGLDRTLKANTSKSRSLSLFKQGAYWFSAIPAMREDRLAPLMDAFGKALLDHAAFSQIFGVV